MSTSIQNLDILFYLKIQVIEIKNLEEKKTKTIKMCASFILLAMKRATTSISY